MTSRTDRRIARYRGGGVRRAAVLLLVAAGTLAAAVPASAEEPLWGETASTLGKGFVNVTTRGSYADTVPFRHHGGAVALTIQRVDLAEGVEVGVRRDLDLHLRLPFVSETLVQQYAGQTVRQTLSGMGEMLLGGKWRFSLHADDRRKDELAVLFDLKLPNGDNNLRDAHGSYIEPHLQPNSGNPGARLGIAMDRHTRRGGYWLSSMVSAETASRRYGRGPMLEVHASAGRRACPLTRPDQLDCMAIAGIHFHWMGKESQRGQTLADSGGSVLSAELGLVASRRALGMRLGVMIPLRSDLGLAHPPPRREIQASFRAGF